MINFHTITLHAAELMNPETGRIETEMIFSPVQLHFSNARNIDFEEGDYAEVLLTDGTRFIMLYENGEWNCCRNNLQQHTEITSEQMGMVRLYGPYAALEEALDDLVAKRNYFSTSN